MLNKEKYAKEIIEIACNGCTVGMKTEYCAHVILLMIVILVIL